MSVKRALLPTMILLLAVGLVGVFVWVMDPVLNFSRIENINLDDDSSYLTVDRYQDDFDLAPKVDLSVIFPAYNEENRLGPNLDGAIKFLEDWSHHRSWIYEIIIVDDGSTDNTAKLALDYFDRFPDIIRVVTMTRNVGKGGAVKVGVANAYGRYILMADADGATDIDDVDHLFMHMTHLEIEAKAGLYKGPAGIVIGSRAHLAKDSIAKREFYRTILMKGFHLLVMMFATRDVQDTQCGFKLFTRDTARTIFAALHTRRWAFDIEVIVIAEALGIPIKEVSVNWREVEGSKLIVTKMDVVTTSLTMARDIVAIRMAYLFGFWRFPESVFPTPSVEVSSRLNTLENGEEEDLVQEL